MALIATQGRHLQRKPMVLLMPARYVGSDPEEPASKSRKLRLEDTFGSGKGAPMQSPAELEGAWTTNPVKWDATTTSKTYFIYDWELTKSPAGAYRSGRPRMHPRAGTVPDASTPIPSKRRSQ